MPQNYTKHFYNFNVYFQNIIKNISNSFAYNTTSIHDKMSIQKTKSIVYQNENLSYDAIRKTIIKELNFWGGLDDVEIYDYILYDIYGGRENLADEFMLSEQGGYDEIELEQIKSNIDNSLEVLRYKKIRNQVLAEFDCRSDDGACGVYTFLTMIFDDNLIKVYNFMISKVGGYQKQEINIGRKNYLRKLDLNKVRDYSLEMKNQNYDNN